MDRISPNSVNVFIFIKSRLGLLPLIILFCLFVAELNPFECCQQFVSAQYLQNLSFLQHEEFCSGAGGAVAQ